MTHKNLNEPTKIIISGVESNTYWNIVVNQCEMKTVLMSYHYLQGKPQSFLADRLEKTPDVKVFIDSGAHTFITNLDKFEDKPMEFWEDYIVKYTDWVRANKDYIFACADLDIDVIVGQEQVDEWREKYFEPLEAEGVQVCYIWHGNRGEDGWEEMCKKYSYTGFSMQNDKDVTVQRLMKRINVAKKYNTRVHGMALTKTEILVRVPFFSADSTTWLVGQQYGELNWFDGRKMKRLLKDEWRRNYKTKLIREPFNADWDKLINGMGGRGDTYELLRLNVIAYRLAEEHIRKRLGNKMYWTKGTSSPTNNVAVKNTSPTNLLLLDFPEDDWFDSDCSDWESYAEAFKISIEDFNKDQAIDILYYYYLLFKAPQERVDELEDNIYTEYAKVLDEDFEGNREEAISFLKQFYLDCFEGERQDFSGGNNRPKERRKYLEDVDFEILDVSESEITSNPALPAPSDMPEVDIYDEELAKNGIQVIRDDKGRFVKGSKVVRKPKNIYSKKYPKLACDTCYKSGDCPEYKAGHVCAFDKVFKKFDTRNLDDLVDAMQSMAGFNLERMQRAMIFETMDGGMPTPEVTGLIDQNMRLLEKIRDLNAHSPKAILSQKKIIKEDGSQEVHTEMNVNPSQGGILSKLFAMDESSNKDEEIVDVDFKAD